MSSNEAYLILGQELMRKAYADDAPEALHLWLTTQLAKLSGAGNENAILTWPDSFDFYDRLLTQRQEYAALPADQRREMSWAWTSWNRMIDPLEPGLLAVLAAGDGMGKTTYCEVQAEHWAKQGFKVAFFHFELNRAIMLDRRAARHTGISRRELKSGIYSEAHIQRWHTVRDRLKQWDGNITYVHTPGWSIEKLLNQLTILIDQQQIDVAVIDYLEKARPSSGQQQIFRSNTWQREADDVEQIKTFAEATETPVMLLAQMNKEGKGKTNIHNLDRTAMRGAGEKSEKANIVVLLHREKEENGGAYSPVVDVRIDKNTLGPTGNFQQWLDGEHFRVHDTERPDAYANGVTRHPAPIQL